MSSITKQTLSLFGFIAVFSLFCTYPVALLPPGIEGSSYFIRIPTMAILTLFSVVVLAAVPVTLDRSVLLISLIYVAVVLSQFLRDITQIEHSLVLLGYLTVPLATATYCRNRDPRFRSVAAPFVALWLLLLIYGAMNDLQRRDVIGITGNRNWMAISILAVTPWTVAMTVGALRSRFGKQMLWRDLICGLAIVAPSLYLLGRCRSRAAWLALIVYGIVWTGWRFKPARRVVYFFSLAGVAVVCVILKPRPFVDAFKDDIRIPTWITTAKLIADHPFTGVGPGSYRREHTPYRARSEYHRRRVAADITGHPHNEFLNVAATIGLPGSVIWLTFLAPLFRRHENETTVDHCARFSAFVIYFHGMLDKPLVQPPSSIIALCTLGVCWRHYVLPQMAFTRYGTAWRPGWAVAAAIAVTAGLAVKLSLTSIRSGGHQRLASIYSGHGEYQSAVHHYQKMTEIDPMNIRGYYGAGSILIQKLMDPAGALPFLNQAMVLDPGFAHVNRLAGKCYGMIGDHMRALQYFQRECTLFPRDITSHQSLFTSMMFTGHTGELIRLERYLNDLYISHTMQRVSLDLGQRLAHDWRRSLDEGDRDAAIRAAAAICSAVDYKIIDPAIMFCERYRIIPPEIMYADFDSGDVDYWNRLRRRDAILAELRSSRLEASPVTWFDIVEYANQRITIDDDLRTFSLPEDLWREGTGNRLSYCCLLAWLNRALSIDTAIYTDALGNFHAIVHDGKQWWHINPEQKSTIAITDVRDLNDGVTGVSAATDKPGMARLFFTAEEFYLRNQILSVVLHHFDPDLKPDFATVPVSAFCRLKTAAAAVHMKLDLNDFVISAPPHHRRPAPASVE